MLTEAQVRMTLRSVLKSSRPDQWTVDFNFREGDMDSLDHATLALYLDENFQLTISDDDLPSLVTIQAILDFANKK